MTQEGVIQPENYFCRKCYTEITATNPECPQCGKNMQTQSHIKSLGKVLIGLGVFITVCGGMFILILIAVLLFAKMSDKDVLTALAAFALSGAVCMTGVAAIIGGVWQAKHGKTSKMFAWIFIGLVVLILIFGRVFSFLNN